MNIGDYIIVLVFLVSAIWIMHKYAVRRANFLVSMELGLLYDNESEDQEQIETAPIRRPAAPTWVSCSVT